MMKREGQFSNLIIHAWNIKLAAKRKSCLESLGNSIEKFALSQLGKLNESD